MRKFIYPRIKSEKTTFFKDSDAETQWVDSIYNKMSLRRKNRTTVYGFGLF